MNTALNKFTKEFVDASASDAQFITCVCPGCGVDVYLAGGDGTFQRIHFRHHRLAADKACKFYHSGSDASNTPDPRETVHRRRRPDLLFEVAGSSSGAFWELLILVPRYEGDYQFQLGNYSPHQHRYDCDELPDGGRTFGVFPQSDPYSIRVFLKSGGEINSPQVNGLGDCAVFVFGHDRARLVPQTISLQWGQVIAIVSRNTVELAAVFDAVDWRKLAVRNGWHATIVGLPSRPHDRIDEWAQRALGRRIRSVDTELSILAPISGGMLLDRTWMMRPGTEEAVVAIRVAAGLRRSVDLHVQSEDGMHEEHMVVDLHDGIGIAQVRLPSGFSKIFADSRSLELGVLVAAEEANRPRPKIAIVFEIHHRFVPVCLWDRALSGHFGAVRAGAQPLVDVRLPERCRIVASLWKGSECADRLEATLPSPGIGANDEGIRIANKLQTWLRGSSGRVELDAEGFGRMIFPPAETARNRVVDRPLNTETRARRQWLELATRSADRARASQMFRSGGSAHAGGLNRLLVHSRYLGK